MTNEPIFLTIEDAAKKLSMGRTWMFERVHFGDIPSVKLGSSRRIPTDALDAFAARVVAEQIGSPVEGAAAHSIAG